MIAVTLRGLSVRYGDAVVLDRVSLVIEPGEIFLLLGPSGSGKTTLLRTIAGFIEPGEGSVHFGEHDVTRRAPHLRGAAMVFQSFALWPHLDVRENVAFGLRQRDVSRGEIEQQVREALDSVRMARYIDRRVDELSGGEQQRVALARALVVRPECLLLDEPLSNLDARLRESMRDEIARVCRERGLTAVYVTHDQREALAIADKIAVMDRGRVLQVGTAREVYRRPVSRSVATFLGETNLLEGTIVASDASGMRVHTAIGELVAAPLSLSSGSSSSSSTPADGGPALAPSQALPASKVWVSIRPESLVLLRGSSEADSREPASGVRSPASNRLTGCFEGTTYFGAIAEHRLRILGQVLRVHELNPQEHPPATGQAKIGVSPDDVGILPFEEPEA